MKRFFIAILCVSLFIIVSSVFASGDNNKKDKASAKVENTVKKTETPKQAETSACCAQNQTSCCAAKDGESKACCAEKKTDSKATASCCSNKNATNETKSSGKKAN